MTEPTGFQDHLTQPGGLARRLRAARGDRTATELARLAGWPISKISKLEHGRQPPTDADLRVLARLTGVGAEELAEWRGLLEAAREVRHAFAEQTREGHRALQRQFTEIIAGAQHIRIFETSAVPRFLQMPDYSRALLAESRERHDGADDIDAAVAERQASVSYLYDPARRFEFVITEPVLGWRFATLPVTVHRAQLNRLLDAVGQPNVRFGIVPLFEPIGWVPQTSFQLYDDLGITEHWLGEVRFTLDEEVALLDRVLANLWESAREGDAAREIIQAALDRLGR